MLISATSLSVGEKFSVGGVTTLLGLGMTFVVLALLICCILLVNLIVKQLDKVKIGKKKEGVAPAVVFVETKIDSADEPIDEETMLAIDAAVKTYVRESASDDGKSHENVKIKSVVRK